MGVAKIIEVSSNSSKSFEDAIVKGVSRASKTVKEVKGCWVKSMKCDVDNGKITMYRVVLKLTFVLND